MAVTQISKITHRKGVIEDLPQLDIGELGWAYDQRRLFIGNAPYPHDQVHPDFPAAGETPGLNVTEILTNESNLLELANSYRYQGEAAGYPHETVQRSLISKLDEYVSVKDYGAVGDGNTDDTEAIRLAIADLYTRSTNPAIRRVLFFPAGVYLITGTIEIPSYAHFAGEGRESSIVLFINTSQEVGAAWATTETGVNNVVFRDIGLETEVDAFLIYLESAYRILLDNVRLAGAGQSLLTDPASNKSLLVIASETSGDSTVTPSELILVKQCLFESADAGIRLLDNTRNVVIAQNEFSLLRTGVTGTAVSHTRLSLNTFQNVVRHGVYFDANSHYNSTHFNSFINVANNVLDPNISFLGSNNLAIGDMFDRSQPLGVNVFINNKKSIAFENARQLAVGSYVRETGDTITVTSGASEAPLIALPLQQYNAFRVDFSFTRDVPGGRATRTGYLKASVDLTSPVVWDEEYSENLDPEFRFSFYRDGTVLRINGTLLSNVLAANGTLTYSITRLS